MVFRLGGEAVEGAADRDPRRQRVQEPQRGERVAVRVRRPARGFVHLPRSRSIEDRVYEAVVDSAAAEARMVQNHRWRGADERLVLPLVEADDRARPLPGCRRLPDGLRAIERDRSDLGEDLIEPIINDSALESRGSAMGQTTPNTKNAGFQM